METTTVHLMRHGEVNNPDGVLYGRAEGFHLTALGRAMAEVVAQHLHEHGSDIRAVVASPLERAQESAQPTAAAFNLDIRTDDRLIEAENKFAGLAINRNRLILAHPRYWPWYLNPALPSWGEPYRQQAQRMRQAVVAALSLGRGGEVLLVSHQLPIWCLRLFVEGRSFLHDPRRRECSLASLTSLIFADNTLVGVSYSEPAALLLDQAADMVPGLSNASLA